MQWHLVRFEEATRLIKALENMVGEDLFILNMGLMFGNLHLIH